MLHKFVHCSWTKPSKTEGLSSPERQNSRFLCKLWICSFIVNTWKCRIEGFAANDTLILPLAKARGFLSTTLFPNLHRYQGLAPCGLLGIQIFEQELRCPSAQCRCIGQPRRIRPAEVDNFTDYVKLLTQFAAVGYWNTLAGEDFFAREGFFLYQDWMVDNPHMQSGGSFPPDTFYKNSGSPGYTLQSRRHCWPHRHVLQ